MKEGSENRLMILEHDFRLMQLFASLSPSESLTAWPIIAAAAIDFSIERFRALLILSYV